MMMGVSQHAREGSLTNPRAEQLASVRSWARDEWILDFVTLVIAT
jgi:hypothetical protein